MNIMRDDHKHGNGWYYGESEVIRKDKGATSFQIHAPDDAFRSEVRIGGEGKGEVVKGKAGRERGAKKRNGLCPAPYNTTNTKLRQ